MTPARPSESCFRRSSPGVGDGAEGGAVALRTDARPKLVNENPHLSESARELARKRPREVDLAEVLPATKKTADRTVRIADFSWTLPPDPGWEGPYPSLIFLTGAAISDSESGVMTPNEICQWVRERYPSRPESKYNVFAKILSRETDFIGTRKGKCGRAREWTLRDPQQFRGYYEKSIFLRPPRGTSHTGRALRNIRLAADKESPGGAPPESSLSSQPASPGIGGETRSVPELSVKMGDRILTLPPYGVDWQMPPIRLLCGCAIALGPEQGSESSEIAKWIADRYSIQGEYAMKQLKASVRTMLPRYNDAFRSIKFQLSSMPGRGRSSIRWLLISPADFAVGYGGCANVTPSEPAQALTRERPHEAGQEMVLSAAKKPTDRTVQIAGFTWTLPPDPGREGPYPKLTFLIGAAISSSNSGMMTISGIRRWIRARYPSRSESADSSIPGRLTRSIDFIADSKSKPAWTGGWMLRDPEQFRRYYEKDIYRVRQPGAALGRTFRNVPATPEQESPSLSESSLPAQPAPPGTDSNTHIAPELLVKIGGYILMLPPHIPGQRKHPLRLLCGCAIALGPEQGAGVGEIVEWIADRYSIRDKGAKKKLNYDTMQVLGTFNRDFRRTDIPAPRRSRMGRIGTRWVLRNPADFAASYGGHACSQDS